MAVIADSSSVKVLPRVGSVEQADPHSIQRAWFEVPHIHTHVGHLSRTRSLPVRDAAAGRAAYKPQCLATPRVRLCGTRFANNTHIRRLVVRPQRAVSATDRAVAVREHARPARDLDPHCSAMTRAGEHALTTSLQLR